MYIKDLHVLANELISLQSEEEIKGFLLFGCDDNRPTTQEMESLLQLNSKPLIGGFFPEIIADGERKKEGFLLISLFEVWEVIAFDASHKDLSFKDKFDARLKTCTLKIGSVFCFVNAFWTDKTMLMSILYDALGPFANYLGGGAGSLSFESFPCVFANQSVIEHGAVVGVMEKHLSLGVAHGWHPISQPIKVTETSGNTIVSLNWEPAFQVYQEWVQSHSKQTINEDNFFEIAKSYPLGLVKLDDEMIIRDPYATVNQTLQIVDEVPEGEYIRIMNGNLDSLLEGAKNAVQQASMNHTAAVTQICIDCISRVLFMQDDFEKELVFLNQKQKANGILSIGEIANPINAPLELFNKTVVVAQWSEKF
jgi:hypothetical protein